MIALVVDELGDAEKFQCGGPENTIQLLRGGKQFVAAGVHPEEKQLYRWEDKDELPINMPALAKLPRVKMTDLVRVLAENGFLPATTSASKPASGRKAELLEELKGSELGADDFGELFVDDGAPFSLEKLRQSNPGFYALYKKYADGVDDPASVSHNGNRFAVWKDFLREPWTEAFTIAHAKVFSLVWPGAGEYVDRKTTKGQCDDERLVNSFSAAEAAIKREKAGEVKQHASTKFQNGEAFGAVEDDESQGDDKPKDVKTEAPKTKFLRSMDIFENFTPPDELIEGLLPAVGTACIVADSNVGKTFFAIHMLDAIMRGEKFFGRNTERGGVLMVAGEGRAGLNKRLAALHEVRKYTDGRGIGISYKLPEFSNEASIAVEILKLEKLITNQSLI
jgi:hypothetical protein